MLPASLALLTAPLFAQNVTLYTALPTTIGSGSSAVASGAVPSTQYSAQVLVGTTWADAYVNFDPARTFGSGSSDEPNKTFSWLTFETDGPTKVRVKRKEGPFNTVVLRPSRYNIATTKIGTDTVEFTINPGQKVSVEFDTEIKDPAYTGAPYGIPIIKDAMMIFADQTRADELSGIAAADIYEPPTGSHEVLTPVTGTSPAVSNGKSTLSTTRKVVRFRPGVYNIGYWQVPNNIEHIHIDGGAIVYGAIDVLPQNRSSVTSAADITTVWRNSWASETLRTSFKMTGGGILSGAKLIWHLKKDFTYTSNDDWWAHVKLAQFAVASLTIRDVTFANSPYWVVSWINDDDERTTGTLSGFKMVGAWTYNNDGLPLPAGASSSISNAFIHADDDALKIYNSGATVSNCVIWQSNNGAVFQFGWFPKSVTSVDVSDIDIIHFENWYGVNQSNRAIFNYANTGGSGTIQDITFNNINVEGKVLRVFGFNITGGTQAIKNFTFTNLNVPGGMGAGQIGAPGRNYFLGAITDFTFTNFKLGSTTVLSATDGQFDFGTTAGAGFIYNTGGGGGGTAPAAPSALTAAAASSSQINLSWADNSTNETGFQVERSANGSTGWTLIATKGAGVTTHSDTGLTASTTYYYRVRATNANGNSAYTPNANATTSAAGGTAPAAPSALTAAATSSSQINLSWTDNSTNETGFQVERSANGSTGWTLIATKGAGVTTHSDTGLTASTTYYYRVRATNASGNSAYTANASATTQAASGALPSPWTGGDIGTVATAGSSSFTSGTGTFTVSGSGADVWGTADEFYFVRQAATDDCEIRARVVSQTNTNAYATAGVMIRQGTGVGSKHVFMSLTPVSGSRLRVRDTASGTTVQNGTNDGAAAPYWVRLVRTGSTFTGYRSTDGVNWTQVGTATVTMNSSVLIGLAVCSHADGTLSTATFTNVSVTP